MPTATEEDWSVIARRMARVPEAYARLPGDASRRARAAGCSSAPRQVRTVVGQLDEWLAGPYFAGFVAGRPGVAARRARPRPRAPPTRPSPRCATSCATSTRRATEGTPDAVGRERYAARGPPLDRLGPRAGQGLEEAYAWGWSEHRRILAEQRIEAEKVLPGRDPDGGACAGSATHGPAVEGVEEIRERLQAMMDEAIAALDGTHFDLAEPVRRVEAMIAPPGSAAAPYYTRPAQDFSRPGPHLAADAGPDPLPALGPGLDLVPRGRSRPPPAAGAVGLRLGGPVDLPDVAGLGQRQRRGLGAVRRAADGRAGLLHRPGRAARLPGRAAAALGAGGHRHRHAPGAADPGRRRGLAGRAPRASRGRRSWRGRSSARTPAPTSPSSTASWSATSASPGRRSATSWASGPGWRAGRRRGRPAAPTSTSRPGTWPRCRRARSASTTSPPSSRGC